MLPKNWKLTSMLLGGLAIGPTAYHSASGGCGYRDCHGVYHCDNESDENPSGGFNLRERLSSGTKVVGDHRFPCRHCGGTDCIGCWGMRHQPSNFKRNCRELGSTLQAHNAHFYGSLNTGLANALGRPVNCYKDDIVHHRGIYPALANRVDPRDQQNYSAQGYGVPMTVPLAPNVGYQYNYGWGASASRMTSVGTDYARYVPAQWRGAPERQVPAGIAPPPMVYAPTDTTQFGYTSAHAPYWQQVPRTPWDNSAGGIVSYSPMQAKPAPQPAGQQPAGGVSVPAPAQ